MVALYPPGSDGLHPCLYQPHARRRAESNTGIQLLEPIFETLIGIPVYQEQIMRAAMELAGIHAVEVR